MSDKNDLNDFDDDDLLDDDLALDDLDDDLVDDLDDQDWDDLDTPAEEQAAGAAKGKQADGAKKSFVSRNFNVIVITLAVLGGGAMFLGNMASAPPATDPAAEQGEAETTFDPAMGGDDALTDNGLLPMGVDDSMNTAATADAVVPTPENASESGLLPLPGQAPLEGASYEGMDTSSDLMALQGQDPVATEGLVPAFGENSVEEAPAIELSTLPSDPALSNTAASPVESNTPEPHMAQADPALAISPESTASGQPDSDLEDLAAALDLSDDLPATQTQAPAAQPASEPAVADLMPAPDSASQDAAADALVNTEGLAQETQTQTVESVPAVPVSSEPAQSPPEPDVADNTPFAPETDTATAPDAPAERSTAPVAAEKPAKAEARAYVAPRPAPVWVLRAAQPGQAVLADQATGDLRTVEIGQRVPGLGTITTVALMDGKWVIQGTEGRVSQ